jgi:hypothetical protein
MTPSGTESNLWACTEVPQPNVPPHTPSGKKALQTSAHSGVDNFRGPNGWTNTPAFTFKRRYNIVYKIQ